MDLYRRPVSTWGLVVCLAPPLVDIDPFWQGFRNPSTANVLLSRSQIWKLDPKTAGWKSIGFANLKSIGFAKKINKVLKGQGSQKILKKLNVFLDLKNQQKKIHFCWLESITDAQGLKTSQKYCACHTKNVTKHVWMSRSATSATRNEATQHVKRPKVTLLQNLP